MSINAVVISGNLTRDPEYRVTSGGTGILNFGVAVNERRKNSQTDEWEDVANFVDCVLFGKRAESLSKIMIKGMKVAVSGRLRYTSWQDKETGRNRSKLEVIADEIDLMQRRDGNASQSAQQPPQGQQQQYQANYPQQQQYQPQSAPQQPQYQPQPQYQQQQTQYQTAYTTSYDNYGR